METLITIKMTENEYGKYKLLQFEVEQVRREKAELQKRCDSLAQMVCRALRGVNDGKIHLGLHTANLLYDYANTLLNWGGKQ